MIYVKISCCNPTSQFLEIELSLVCQATEHVILQLPAWRAGRYQLANYAQNIRGFQVKDVKGEEVRFQKISKDRWEILPIESEKLTVTYAYWAGKMDAGSAWVDDQQVYLNLVNCCFEVLGRSEEEIVVKLDLPDLPIQISTLRQVAPSNWKADNFQMLADSTVLAAKALTHWNYQVEETRFHIWIHGQIHFDQELFISRLEAFSKKMIEDFGGFPEKAYQFIFQLLPYAHYHGVEHQRGTVITFGPAEALQDPDQMEELLGISCHELYHAWNVCRIRPKELLPYDFSKETYTQNGLILEGITTYMGDLYLLKSKVYDIPTYLKHLEKVIARESSHFGWKNYNILESSFDLWLDGYVQGIPDRKLNIYSRGALISLCIDILLLKSGSSLSFAMRSMWKKFGKPLIGYDWRDFEGVLCSLSTDPREVKFLFSNHIYGYEDIFPLLESLLPEIGLHLNKKTEGNPLLHKWGIRTKPDRTISQIHPESFAYGSFMINDQILQWNEAEISGFLVAKINRLGRVLQVKSEPNYMTFFPEYFLEISDSERMRAKWMS